MKKLLFLFLSLAIILPSCKDDDDVINDNVLQYDGANQSAPIFEVGVSEPAVYFPSSYLQSFIGKKINELEFFVGDIPAEMVLRISQEDGDNQPGLTMFEEDITGLNIQSTSWNLWQLDNPIEIRGDKGLWLSISVKHNNSDERSIGCDTGPAVNNGDWIFSDSDNEWKTLRNRTNNAVDINWNIRANLTD